jgi:hypothetical protein
MNSAVSEDLLIFANSVCKRFTMAGGIFAGPSNKYYVGGK